MVEDSTAFSAKDHFAKVFSKVPPTAILPGTPTEIAMVCRRKRHKKRGCAEITLGTPPLISGYWVGLLGDGDRYLLDHLGTTAPVAGR